MDFAKIRPRGGTKAQWETTNPVLGKREMGVQWESEIGVGKVVIKFGNGITAWNNLDTAVEVENDLVNKIISSIVTVSDEYPILNDGDSLSTLVGKIKKYIQDLKDKKLDKSARYDGTDSTSTELVPTANALRGVNAKADKNASDITTTNNNLSNAGIPTVKKITDLYAIKKSGFYCYDAGASNAPMSSRGGMIVANYLSDSWISLTVVPYALSKIYTNTKYNNTWVGWAESATKDDLPIIGKFTNKKNKDIIKIGSVVKSRSVVCVFPRYNTLTTVRCIYPSLEISAGEDQFQLFAWDTNTQNDSTSTNLDGYYIVMPMLSK